MHLSRVTIDVLRQSARALARSPGHPGLAAAALGLGLALSTAIFIAADTILLRPHPFPEPDRLVTVWGGCAQCSGPAPAPPGSYRDWRERARSLERWGAMRAAAVTLGSEGAPERVQSLRVTDDFFQALGTAAHLGRTLVAGDAEGGGPTPTVLGYDLWRRRFGGDQDIVGAEIRLDGEPRTVVGVMPPGFTFPDPRLLPVAVSSWLDGEPELWTPLRLTPEERGDRSIRSLFVVARLAPGRTLEAAREEMHDLALSLAREFPEYAPPGADILVVPLSGLAGLRAGGPLRLLATGVGLTLALTLASVAILLLVRSAGRTSDRAVRLTMGASPGRIRAEVFVEAAATAAFAAVAALPLAELLLALARGTAPAEVPRIEDLGLDARGLLIWAGVSFPVVAAVAAVPGRVSTSPRNNLLGAGAGPGMGMAPFRTLMGVQAGLALALAGASGLLLKSFLELVDADPGIRPESVVLFDVAPVRERYPGAPELNAFYGPLLDRLARLPEVEAAGAVAAPPLTGHRVWGTFTLDGREDEDMVASYQLLDGRALEALGMELVAGRSFGEADGPPVAMVNEAFARRFLADRDPVGSSLGMWQDFDVLADPPVRRIVGVVADVKQASLAEVPEPQIFLPRRQVAWRRMTVALRLGVQVPDLNDRLRGVTAAVDSEVPLARIRTMDDVVAASLAGTRFLTTLFLLLGGSTAVLAVVSVYATAALIVRRQRREMGIRLAVGASPSHIGGEVLRGVLGPTGAGAAAGLVGLLLLGGLLRAHLYEVGAADPWILGGSVALLALLTSAAALRPALAASRTDPAESLRA